MSSGLTVVQLRAALRKRDLDSTGLKADLVARLDEAIAADGDGKKTRAAKRKVQEEEEEQEGDSLPDAKRAKLNEFKKMTVPQLSKALRERNLATTGRKQELFERLAASLENDDDQDDDAKDAGTVKDDAADSSAGDAKADDAKDVKDDAAPGDARADESKSRRRKNGKEAKKEKEEEAKMVKGFKKGRAVLDDYLDDHIKASCHVLEEGDDVYDAMLNQTNIAHNNNKYYKLQVLEADDKSRYYVRIRYGRVGHPGQGSLEAASLNSAKARFEQKFREKTKNAWSSRHQFVPYTGKYTLLEMDYEEDEEDKKPAKVKKEANKGKAPAMTKEVESKLDSRVAQFVSLICDLKMMKQQMVEIGYDARKMPLGKLSKASILKGYEILKAIQAALETRGNAQALLDLSSEFYTLIPHDFGFKDIRNETIRTSAKLKEKIAMVEALGEITIAAEVLKEDENEDDPAFAHYKRLKCELEPLDQSDDEYRMVHDYMKNTHGQTHRNYDLNLLQVFKVQRNDEDGNFQQFAQTPNRMLLWHGSRLTNWTGILSQGLRIAPPEAPSTGYMFGKGVYFADMVSKSANYCFTSSTSPRGVLLLCEVALGNMNELYHADYNASNLPPGKLSTKGLGRTVPNSSQFKTLPDGVVVPLGHPKPSSNRNTSLEYNEYIVYSTKQIRMRYLLQVDFQYKPSYY